MWQSGRRKSGEGVYVDGIGEWMIDKAHLWRTAGAPCGIGQQPKIGLSADC